MQERKALNAQLETLRKADRVLTRDPEIVSLIGATDDDLLFELRKETAEEKLGNKPKKDEREILDMTPPEMPKESPKSAAEILKEKEEQQRKATAKPAQEEKKMPKQPSPPQTGPPSPHHTAPNAPSGAQHPQAPGQKPATKSNLFGK